MSTTDTPDNAPLDLGAYRWQNRLLLVFTPSPEDRASRQQHSFLGQSGELLQRDLIVATIYGQTAGQIGYRMISCAESETLRAQFGVAPDTFTAILIGKDGGEKRRFHAPVAPHELFAIIDDMPMRQAEMGREA